MNDEITRTLQPIEEEDRNIPAKLDVAKRALAEATEDWERIDNGSGKRYRCQRY